MSTRIAYLSLIALLVGCPQEAPKTTKKPIKPKPPASPKMDRIERMTFNTVAAELYLPFFWVEDKNGNKTLDPDELAVLWGLTPNNRGDFVEGGKFKADFAKAYERMVKHHAAPAPKDPRAALVRQELQQGRPTLVHNDFTKASAEDRAILRNVLEAAVLIEKIFAKQNGVDALNIPSSDSASRMVFYRNQGPWCVAPKTESTPACNAMATPPTKRSGLYPAKLQDDKDFCDKLAKRKDGAKLMHQFHTVVAEGSGFKAVPYSEAYAAEMKQISDKLKAAADAIQSPNEAAFKAYLLATSKAFLTNEWQPADEAWSKMSVKNSKWYLRIGPDEVYFEPCSRKAGFHVSFARINQDSLKWQNKLDPVKGDMEKALAKLAGKPYKARKVSFHLPDFIDIVINAGDSRSPHGATIGQSLPNWGPVANEGRGRTVAMTNLYTDPDSKSSLKAQTESLLCKEAMAKYTTSAEPQVMSTVLHEAAHNLGPAHEYKVKGKTASQIFGGPLASTLEELKSQTAALYFTDWLQAKSLITQEMVEQAHTRDIVWAFGHISRGMYTASKKPKPYSQLAAIQFGFLQKEGAIEWKADTLAANGKDKGCLMFHLNKFPPAILKLMTQVGKIKAKGDKKSALALRAEFVDGKESPGSMLHTIRERWLRAPKASFVYAVDM